MKLGGWYLKMGEWPDVLPILLPFHGRKWGDLPSMGETSFQRKPRSWKGITPKLHVCEGKWQETIGFCISLKPIWALKSPFFGYISRFHDRSSAIRSGNHSILGLWVEWFGYLQGPAKIKIELFSLDWFKGDFTGKPRTALYLVKTTLVSCRISFKPIQWIFSFSLYHIFEA